MSCLTEKWDMNVVVIRHNFLLQSIFKPILVLFLVFQFSAFILKCCHYMYYVVIHYLNVKSESAKLLIVNIPGRFICKLTISSLFPVLQTKIAVLIDSVKSNVIDSFSFLILPSNKVKLRSNSQLTYLADRSCDLKTKASHVTN